MNLVESVQWAIADSADLQMDIATNITILNEVVTTTQDQLNQIKLLTTNVSAINRDTEQSLMTSHDIIDESHDLLTDGQSSLRELSEQVENVSEEMNENVQVCYYRGSLI